MLTPLLSDKELFDLMKIIQEAQKIVICAHRGPDGDAVGSCLAWSQYLHGLGKQVSVIMPNPFPDFLKWIPGSQYISFYDKNEANASNVISKAHLVFCLDFNALSRLQEMGKVIENAKADRIIIDHHLNPDRNIAKMVISHPEMSSTSELVFRLIDQLGGYDDMN